MSTEKLSIRKALHLLHKDGRRCVASLLACMMLAVVLFGGMHHHADWQDHPDCSICASVHHQHAESALHSACFPTPPAAQPTEFATKTQSFISVLRLTSQSRAPPA